MARSIPSTEAPRVGDRIKALEKRISVLESERPGRKPQPLLAIRQRGICGLDPSRDSATCPDASIYRYQNGCHGDACRAKQHNAYTRRKDRKRAEVKKSERAQKRAAKKAADTATAPPAPTKTPTKTPTKKTIPVKRTPRKATPSKRPVSKSQVAKKVTKAVSKRPVA